MFDTEKYIKSLIKEAFGKRNVLPDDDELEYDDEYSSQEEPETQNIPDATQQKGRIQGGRKYMQNKNAHNAALDRIRKNLPYNNDAFAAPWMDNSEEGRNPRNKSVKDPLTADSFGRIKVMAHPIANPKKGKYNEPIVLVTMVNIDPEDCVEICRNFARVGHTADVTVARTRQNNTKDGVTFVVLDKFINQWKEEDLNNILDFIGSFKNEDGTPKYLRNEQDKENIKQYVSNRVMSGSDLGSYFTMARKNNIELFNAFIEADSDEKVQEFINMYQRFNLSNMLCSELGLSSTFGRILSTQNAALVLGSGRLTGAGVRPTFILTENIWRTKFGRIVNPNAVPFPIWVPSKRNIINAKKEGAFTSKPYFAKDANGNDVEINKTSDVLNVFFLGKTWDELSEQQKISANIMCNFINPSGCYMMYEYDVSDTTLVDPNGPDKFNEEIGLTNRFSGELNKAAMDFLKAQNIAANGDTDDGADGDNMNAFDAQIEQLNEYALKNVNEYCEVKGITYQKDNESTSLALINALKEIARRYITLKKEENIQVLVNDAVYAACMVMKIGLDVVKSLRIGKPSNDIEYSQYAKAFSVLMDVINGNWKDNEVSYSNNLKAVSESVENKSFNPFANKKYSPKELEVLASIALPDNKVALDTFDTLTERMNKSKTNLLY